MLLGRCSRELLYRLCDIFPRHKFMSRDGKVWHEGDPPQEAHGTVGGFMIKDLYRFFPLILAYCEVQKQFGTAIKVPDLSTMAPQEQPPTNDCCRSLMGARNASSTSSRSRHGTRCGLQRYRSEGVGGRQVWQHRCWKTRITASSDTGKLLNPVHAQLPGWEEVKTWRLGGTAINTTLPPSTHDEAGSVAWNPSSCFAGGLAHKVLISLHVIALHLAMGLVDVGDELAAATIEQAQTLQELAIQQQQDLSEDEREWPLTGWASLRAS